MSDYTIPVYVFERYLFGAHAEVCDTRRKTMARETPYTWKIESDGDERTFWKSNGAEWGQISAADRWAYIELVTS